MTPKLLTQRTLFGLTPERAETQRKAGLLPRDNYRGFLFAWQYAMSDEIVWRPEDLSPGAREAARSYLLIARAGATHPDKALIDEGIEALRRNP